MPKLLQINNFAQGGLNTDIMPWELPGNYLTDLKNIRILTGILSPFGGYSVWSILPLGFNPGFLMPAGAISSPFWIITGLERVFAFDGTNYTDISSAAGYSTVLDELLWNGCLLGQIPIINHESHVPEYWPQQSISFDMLPLPWDASTDWATKGESAKIIRSHKQFLFALNLVTQGQEIPDGVRWSSIADKGGIPSTWDPLDITNVAGFVSLGGAGGRIVDGRSLRDAFVVYRESSISIFDFVGGQFVWQIRHFSDTNGLISPHALVEVKGVHYFIGDGDILRNDGNTITSLLHNRIRRRFVSSFDSDNFKNSYAVKNNVASEAWFCIPTQGKTFPDVAYIYNWEDDTWSIRDIPEAAFANYGPQSSAPLTWGSIDAEATWKNIVGVWSQSQISPLNETIIAAVQPDVLVDGKLLRLDKSISSSSIVFDTRIERLGFALEGLNTVTTITRIYPHMRGPGTVQIRVGSQDHPGASVRWKNKVNFNAETDRKVDVRTTGELHCFEFSTTASNDQWELTGMDIEYVVSGAR